MSARASSKERERRKIVAIGPPLQLLGWALVGVELIEAVDADDVRRAWSELDDEVGLVVLTPEAREALPARLESSPLWATLPS